VSPDQRRDDVAGVRRRHGVSELRAIKALGYNRSTIRYQRSTQAITDEQVLVAEITRLCGLKHLRRYGYRRITWELCNRHGWVVNQKRVKHLMRENGLLRQPPKKRSRAKGASANSITVLPASHVGHVWTYDFITIHVGRASKVRMLTIIDEYSRFCFPPLIQRSITAEDVVNHLSMIFILYGVPELIRSDNSPEFTAWTVKDWLRTIKVGTAYVAPASPWENGYVETFHDKLRDECLNGNVFFSRRDAEAAIREWVDHYNHDRPHSGLGNRTPYNVRYANHILDPEHTTTLTQS